MSGAANRHGLAYRPLRPARDLRPGHLVRWLPPKGAYSAASEQAKQAGRDGLVVRPLDSETALITFGDGIAIICNAAYLEQYHV